MSDDWKKPSPNPNYQYAYSPTTISVQVRHEIEALSNRVGKIEDLLRLLVLGDVRELPGFDKAKS